MFGKKLPYVVLQIKGRNPERLMVKENEYVIGSAEDCHLQINAPAIANRHISLLKTEIGWVVRKHTVNTVMVRDDQLKERDLTVRSGDAIKISNLVLLTFFDPQADELARKAKKNKNKEQQEDGKRTSPVMLLAAILFVLTSGPLLVYGLVREKPVPPVDFTKITQRSIDAAVRDLSHCVSDAAARIKNKTVRADHDLKSAFWRLASHYADANLETLPEERQDETLLHNLQLRTQRSFARAMVAEEKNDNRSARNAYELIHELVPDFKCTAYQLAAARLQVLPQ